MDVDLGQLIKALSDTVDLVGVDELLHSKRVGCMTLETSRSLGYPVERQRLLYRAALLHDCGVSSTRIHQRLVDEFDWSGADHHCQVGADRVARFGPLAGFGPIIRHHHRPWPELCRLELPEELRVNANVIYLHDRVDALGAMCGDSPLACRDRICAKISSVQKDYFQEDLVQAFLEVSEREAFWIRLEPPHLGDYLRHQLAGEESIVLDQQQLRQLGTLFAEIVDAKSPYTAEHSFGVARLAGYLAEKLGLGEVLSREVEIAGLLHDLGKLQVPDDILESEGALEGASLAVMRHHSYVSMTILRRISGLERIADWVADHHERLDGSGYPFRKTGRQLPPASRVIAVADMYQALAQDRPYRPALSPGSILEILRKQALSGKIDRESVAVVAAETERCHEAAIGSANSF